MTTRTSDTVVCFRHPFSLKGVDRMLAPGEYRVTTEEEAIEGLSFLAYRRVSTLISLPTHAGRPSAVGRDQLSVEMMSIHPLDLRRALEQDAATVPR
jgi:hypothetical protein